MNNPNKPQEWKSEELKSRGESLTIRPSTVDGEGVHVTLSSPSGCMFHCEGCYNAATWSFNAGIPYTKLEQIMKRSTADYVQGLTLLGGEPFSIRGILLVETDSRREANRISEVWTGYTWGGDDAEAELSWVLKV